MALRRRLRHARRSAWPARPHRLHSRAPAASPHDRDIRCRRPPKTPHRAKTGARCGYGHDAAWTRTAEDTRNVRRRRPLNRQSGCGRQRVQTSNRHPPGQRGWPIRIAVLTLPLFRGHFKAINAMRAYRGARSGGVGCRSAAAPGANADVRDDVHIAGALVGESEQRPPCRASCATSSSTSSKAIVRRTQRLRLSPSGALSA